MEAVVHPMPGGRARWRAALLLPLLAGAALAGNVFGATLHFGVDILFGSIAVLVVLRLYGLGWGLAAALLAGAYTVPLWGHPYALLIFTVEALWVGIALRRGHALLPADGAFWFCAGIPLVALCYGGLLGMDLRATALIALKQSVNGIANAVLASLALDLLPIGRWMRETRGLPAVPVRQLLFDLMVASALLPAMAAIFAASHAERRALEQEVWRRLDREAERAAAAVALRREEGRPPEALLAGLAPQDLALQLVDGVGRLVASAGRPAAAPGDPGTLSEVAPGRAVFLPGDRRRATMLRWHDAAYVREMAVGGAPDWRLRLLAPAAPVQARVYAAGAIGLALVLGLSAVIFLLAALASRRLARPLVQLAEISGTLPATLEKGGRPDWPEARTREVRALVANVRSMTGTLRRTFEEMRRQAIDLEQANRALEEEIAHREQLERQVREKQKMEAVGRLAGGIAHDFNNVLTAILGHAELLRDGLPEGSERARAAGEVVAAARRGRRLVRQILSFSRSAPEERRPVALRPIVEETVRFLRASLPTTIALDVASDGSPAVVEADPTRVQQILMNLAANAEAAIGPREGRLAIDMRTVDLAPPESGELRPGRYVRLTVRDDGCGIAPHDLARIFEPFFTTKPVGEGTGLGLAVVHGIVTAYGGAIRAESEPGQGTAFHVFLPVSERAAEGETERPAPAPLGRGRVLVIDDEPTLARLAGRMLARLGYEAVSETSAGRALARFRRDPARFAAVLTDETMPELPGDLLAKELRAIRPELPIVLMTGFSQRVEGRTARDLGVSVLLAKPFDTRELGRALARALAADQNRSEAGTTPSNSRSHRFTPRPPA